jgi:DNA invertase Pin-like site-specific DNA recombinase
MSPIRVEAVKNSTAQPLYVSYMRVSTAGQGASGLGLEAQDAAIKAFAAGGKIVKAFTEVESGKRSDRPQLAAALAECRRRKATLLIARLDRLSRNVLFIAQLMESGVEFIACDMPTCNKFTVHIMAAVAQQEAEMISKRTKLALAAAKARGVRLGGTHKMTVEDHAKGQAASLASRRAKAAARAADVLPVIQELQAVGVKTLSQLAIELTARGITTPRGAQLTPWGVSKLMMHGSK